MVARRFLSSRGAQKLSPMTTREIGTGESMLHVVDIVRADVYRYYYAARKDGAQVTLDFNGINSSTVFCG